MNAPDQLRAKGRVDRTVTLQPGHGGELLRPDDHAKVTLAAFGISGMAPMLFTFVNDLKVLRFKRRFECRSYLLSPAHNFTSVPPSILMQTV